MTIHDLKIWPEFFEPVNDRRKTFEIRKVDREFREDDVLILREFFPARGVSAMADQMRRERGVLDGEAYTGRVAVRRVTYVLGDWSGFVLPGHVTLGLGDPLYGMLIDPIPVKG